MRFEDLCLTGSGFVYLRLQSLIHCVDEEIQSGYRFRDSSAHALVEIIKECVPDRTLILDCTRVDEFTDRAWAVVFSSENQISRKIVLTSLGTKRRDVVGQLDIANASYSSPTANGAEQMVFINCDGTGSHELIPLEAEARELERDDVKKIVANSYMDYGGDFNALPSTSILAKGEFDAKKIISNRRSMFFVCQLMADDLENFILDHVKTDVEAEGTDGFKVLAVSLRGAPLAAFLSMLLKRQFDFIDHLGPKHKLFDHEILETMEPGVKYLYVGDFIIAGTEVKIAQTYARIGGCELNHAYTIASLFPEDRYRSFKSKSLFKILDVVKNADYKLNLPE
jgi:hypothetical protein